MTMQRAFTPLRLAGLELRNRVIKTATFEGMSPGGVPSAMPELLPHDDGPDDDSAGGDPTRKKGDGDVLAFAY